MVFGYWFSDAMKDVAVFGDDFAGVLWFKHSDPSTDWPGPSGDAGRVGQDFADGW